MRHPQQHFPAGHLEAPREWVCIALELFRIALESPRQLYPKKRVRPMVMANVLVEETPRTTSDGNNQIKQELDGIFAPHLILRSKRQRN